MTTERVEIRKCDRCSDRRETPGDKSHAWGRLWAEQVNGPQEIKRAKIERDEIPALDLCPPCLNDLMCWWKRQGRHTPQDAAVERKQP